MLKSKLIELLCSNDEDDVVIYIDGKAYEIAPNIEHIPEEFDGFATAWPAAIGLIPKTTEE